MNFMGIMGKAALTIGIFYMGVAFAALRMSYIKTDVWLETECVETTAVARTMFGTTPVYECGEKKDD